MKFSPLRHVWRKACLSGGWTARTANSFPIAQRRKKCMRCFPKPARLKVMTSTNEWAVLGLIWKHPDINNLLCLSRDAIIWVCMHWCIRSIAMSTKQCRNISQRQLKACQQIHNTSSGWFGESQAPRHQHHTWRELPITRFTVFTNYASTNQMAAALRWLPKDT